VAPGPDDLAARLADVHRRLDYPPGVMAGVLELPILDPILDELDARFADEGADDQPARILAELERLADLLLTGMLGTSPDALQRRVRVVDLLRRADRGRLPPSVADEGDAFGVELRTMLETDADLRRDLGALYPLIARATSVSPAARWSRDAAGLLDASDHRDARIAAVRRVLAALVRADVVSRPDILVGGLRLANQRFARGLLWLSAAAGDGSVQALEAVGLRMGTSGRSDAVVRDTALANTAAALLGVSGNSEAPAALASMRLEITNRNVLKHVDRALAGHAARAGISVDELVDAALPTFGLDPAGHMAIEAGSAIATIEVGASGRVDVLWRGEDAAPPGLIAEVEATVARIENGVAQERRRLERRLASERSWSMARWRRRFGDHPVAMVHARSLIWNVRTATGVRAALPLGAAWITVDEAPLPAVESDEVWLWHPADTSPAEISAWRATLAARGVSQAVSQAEREIFVRGTGPTRFADTRHAGRIVDQPRPRALLRERGWAVPVLGAWDQGDEATAWREFEGGIRAELRYQAPDRTPTGERVARARIVAVRFVRADSDRAAVRGAIGGMPVPLADVPPRVFSEALRDVSLAVTE